MTFLCDKHYVQGTVVAMAAKMPEVILTEYGPFSTAPETHFRSILNLRGEGGKFNIHSRPFLIVCLP